MCVGIAPRHFRLDHDDRSHPVRAEIEPDQAVLDAAESCPMEAIAITDAQTGAEPATGWIPCRRADTRRLAPEGGGSR
jgi:ferredoxin